MKNRTLTNDLINVSLFTTKLLWKSTKLIVKHTPHVVVTLASAKRKLVVAIENELSNSKKERLKDKLDEKIANLKKS
jgi:hypothetical protein